MRTGASTLIEFFSLLGTIASLVGLFMTYTQITDARKDISAAEKATVKIRNQLKEDQVTEKLSELQTKIEICKRSLDNDDYVDLSTDLHQCRLILITLEENSKTKNYLSSDAILKFCTKLSSMSDAAYKKALTNKKAVQNGNKKSSLGTQQIGDIRALLNDLSSEKTMWVNHAKGLNDE